MFKGRKSELIEYLENQDDDRIFKLKMFRKKRTLPQNSYFHVICDMIADKIGMQQEQVKRILMKATFGVKQIRFGDYYYEEPEKPSSKMLKIDEMIWLIETSVAFANEVGCELDMNNLEKQLCEHIDNNMF